MAETLFYAPLTFLLTAYSINIEESRKNLYEQIYSLRINEINTNNFKEKVLWQENIKDIVDVIFFNLEMGQNSIQSVKYEYLNSMLSATELLRAIALKTDFYEEYESSLDRAPSIYKISHYELFLALFIGNCLRYDLIKYLYLFYSRLLDDMYKVDTFRSAEIALFASTLIYMALLIDLRINCSEQIVKIINSDEKIDLDCSNDMNKLIYLLNTFFKDNYDLLEEKIYKLNFELSDYRTINLKCTLCQGQNN